MGIEAMVWSLRLQAVGAQVRRIWDDSPCLCSVATDCAVPVCVQLVASPDNIAVYRSTL